MTELIHSFHIPVMGTAFTIESPVKIARFGISSVISCVDDILIERMRKYYCRVTGSEYVPISRTDHDARARRITAYLNLMDEIVKEQFDKLKTSAFEIGSEITRYFDLLPDESSLKQMYRIMLSTEEPAEREKVEAELRKRIRPGTIDVNIMTKLDRTNYDEAGEPLPSEFTDALAALRGYANSTLSSSIVFSAGFNGRLYSYVEQFPDFHADEQGSIKKKIVIKVNDFRSALTQGKFFAKKGIWVSEYRLESGLNCGGHAFGHGGNLMGPNLEEFKEKREEFVSSLFEIYNKARAQKGKETFQEPHLVRITAQGGIGTAGEQRFLLNYYELDGTGWGTPFLLVPEATTTDDVTLKSLCVATKDDLCLSDVSPLGIPFNNLKTSASERAKYERIKNNKPGSPCSKGYLVSNTEFSKNPICIASYRYQKKKLEELQTKGLSSDDYQTAAEAVIAKACLCNDLGGAAVLSHDLAEPKDLPSPPAICPGPNLAYFSRPYSLQEMVDHIYGRKNILSDDETRPNMFITELNMYIDYLNMEIEQSLPSPNDQRVKYFNEFKENLYSGVSYYEQLLSKMTEETKEYRDRVMRDLHECLQRLTSLVEQHEGILTKP
jgi:hypothetical protein